MLGLVIRTFPRSSYYSHS